jgi:hypothetical protein
MISYLSNATSFNETQFQHPDLPDSWSWGFSGTLFTLSRLSLITLTDQFLRIGTCELYLDPSKATKCYYAFPPLFSIQDLVAKALSNSNDPDTAATISTWNSALSVKPSDPAFSALANSDSQRARSVSFFRGAAAAIVFSLLISLSSSFTSLALISTSIEEKSTRKYRYTLFGIAIFDALLFATGIGCFTFGVMVGPNGFASGGAEGVITSSVELGFVFVLAGLMCRFISVPVIGFVVLCILGIELLVILLIGYLIWKFMFKIVENHEPV